MHKAKFNDGKECTAYDSFDEVLQIAPRAPRFCEKCGKELHYASYFDNLNRFTLKGYCVCHFSKTPAMSEEAYVKHMLDYWTKRVKERAGNRCEMASPECAGELHAHHIIPKRLDPNKMFDVENGICLCAAHHKKIHSFM